MQLKGTDTFPTPSGYFDKVLSGNFDYAMLAGVTKLAKEQMRLRVLLLTLAIVMILSGACNAPSAPPSDPTRQYQLALAAKLGLPEGYRAEVLIEPQLLSPIFIAATSDDKLLVAEHYGDRLLRIDPVTADVECIYQLPHGAWNGLLSDGADGAYLLIGDHIDHIAGDGTYSKYSAYGASPAALGSGGEIYCFSFSRSNVLVIRSSDQKPETIATGFSNIFDLVRAQDGTLYVSDWDRGTVTRIDPDGIKTVLPADFTQKGNIDLAFAPDGTLYIHDDVGFYEVDPKSGTLTTISWVSGREGVHPLDFTFLSDGNAYFVDPTHNNLIRADFKTNKMDIVIVGQGNSRALDIGLDGAVYIGENSGFPYRRARVMCIADRTVEVYADNLDAITDLSFTPDGNLFVTTYNRDDSTSSALLITPRREVQTLARWDECSPGFRLLWSVSVDPKTGLAIAYDNSKGQLISIDRTGNISTLPHSFHFATTMFVYLAHATDGTLYAIEVNKKGYDIGPLVERNIIYFDEVGHPEIVTDFNHVGSQTAENLDIGPDGNIYALGYKLEGTDMCLWRITSDGKKTLLSDKLPIDPLAVTVDAQGNIYVACSAGLLQICPP